MNWDDFSDFLKETFQRINEGSPPLSPQEFWNQYGEQIQQLDSEIIEKMFTDFGGGIWLPKPYEAARVLYHLRQRRVNNDGVPNDGRDLVGSMRIEVQSRSRPIRSLPREDLDGMYRTLADIGGKERYSRFQVDGWRVVDSVVSQRKGLVLVAPTGAGKTEVFLLPLIAHIGTRLNNPSKETIPHFVLVYPRVALLKDQLSRVLLYANRASQHYSGGQHNLFNNRIHDLQNPIVVGLQYSGIKSKRTETYKSQEVFDGDRFLTIDECPEDGCNGYLVKGRARSGRGIVPLRCTECQNVYSVTLSREDHEREHPHLLVTTLESLDNIYLNPKVESYIRNIEGIVFDEVHLYNSLYGAHVANVIQRVEDFQEHNRPLIKIASSATVSNPERFAAKLFYKDENTNVVLHDAHTDLDLETAGVETLIFLRSPEGDDVPPPQATLLQTAMAVERGILQPGDRTILFTESVDHVNRTSIQLRNAEVDQQLWRFRSIVNDIQYEGNNCPQSHAFICDIYAAGECWRGINGGVNCTTHDNILISPLDVNVISSRNANLISDGDLIVASPSLEVGVDDPNFKSTIHYRTPFNVFSFIQRRGRAGRSGNDMALTVMVLGNDANDEFYFRRRNRLIDGSNYELPLNPNNAVIQDMHQAMEQERLVIQGLSNRSGYSHDLKSLLLWLLNKYVNCSTLNRLFSDELNSMYQGLENAGSWAQVQRQQESFRRWINEKHDLFKKYLDIEIMLQELEARIPEKSQQLVSQLRHNIQEYQQGNETVRSEIITTISIQITQKLSELIISQTLTDREQRELQWLHQLTIDISRGYRVQERLDIQTQEITALYQFFTVWYEKLNDVQYGNVPLNYVPQAIKLTLQSLYYIGTTCLTDQAICTSCVEFYIPDSYFQEVKPILVQTLSPDELVRGQDETIVEVEDSTKLASMLTLYKPFYRYAAQTELMSILVTEHDPSWAEQLQDGQIVVGIQLRVDGLHQDDNSLLPRRLFVRPIKADNEGKNVLKLCTRCYRLHDEDTQQACSCGSILVPVKLYSQPLLERHADISSHYSISENFLFCEKLTGHTIIHGSEVTYKRMIWNSGEYQPRNEDPMEFTALYRNRHGQSQPLKYSILTRGIVWELNNFVDSILHDESIQNALQEYGKSLNRELVLHTAAHMLYKAIASLSGVSQYVLEYAIFPDENRVIIWERYEGGVGLSEIVRDLIRENPLTVYQELLYSAACPVNLSNSVSQLVYSNESLRQRLAEQWILGVDDELIQSVVREAVAEKRAAINNQAEDEIGCIDGCPACIQISMCTDRGNQVTSVSRLVAEKIIEKLIIRDLDVLQLQSVRNMRIANNLPDLEILRYDENRERYDVLCL
jgi:ATP-dependent helicase YprA (DUF1998 family)